MGWTRVIQEDLEESIEVVIAGHQKKNAILSPKKKIVSYHEIGHALVAANRLIPPQFIKSPSSPEPREPWDIPQVEEMKIPND